LVVIRRLIFEVVKATQLLVSLLIDKGPQGRALIGAWLETGGVAMALVGQHQFIRIRLDRFPRDSAAHGGDGGFSGGTDHGKNGRRSSGVELVSPLLNESDSRYGRADRLGPVCLRVCALKTLP
jgi:hypothetical protein